MANVPGSIASLPSMPSGFGSGGYLQPNIKLPAGAYGQLPAVGKRPISSAGPAVSGALANAARGMNQIDPALVLALMGNGLAGNAPGPGGLRIGPGRVPVPQSGGKGGFFGPAE